MALDISPLRDSRRFRLLWSGHLVAVLGRQVTLVALPVQVYRLTGSALDVGLLGAVQVMPLVAVTLAAGAFADRVDRRRLLLLTQSMLGATAAALLLTSLMARPPLALLYLLVALNAAFFGVDAPTRSAVIPSLVSPGQLNRAISLDIAAFTGMGVAGPALAGVVIAEAGIPAAYLVDVLTFTVALVAVARLPALPATDSGPREGPLQAVRAGFAFARGQPAIIGGFAIDIAAMLFGLPRAVFTALNQYTFHAGTAGVGLLYAAPGAGAVLAAITAGWLTHVRRQGRVIAIAVAVWGVAIVAFGLTTALVPALLLLAVAGAADSVSAVCRSTMLQTLTPDRLRGRLNSVYFMVVVGGPFLGDLEGGAVAQATTPAISVVSGGVLCLLGLAVALVLFPAVWRYRSPDPSPGPRGPRGITGAPEAAPLP